MNFINSLIEWTNKTFLPYGNLGLFTVAFMESSFFPIPPDLLLIALSLASPEKAIMFAAVTTAGSVFGGMFGYLIGYAGKLALLEKMFSKNKIEKVHRLFNKYESWAIFIAGFTPIPYKVFTIAGGVFYINFKKFVIASILSRGLRFFIEALLIMFFGKFVIAFLNNYFNLITVILVLLAILIYIYKKRKK